MIANNRYQGGGIRVTLLIRDHHAVSELKIIVGQPGYSWRLREQVALIDDQGDVHAGVMCCHEVAINQVGLGFR